MRLIGTRFDGPSWAASYRVVEAVATPERIALDWIENGAQYHLLAHSQDGGLTYRGKYGMFRPNARQMQSPAWFSSTGATSRRSSDTHYVAFYSGKGFQGFAAGAAGTGARCSCWAFQVEIATGMSVQKASTPSPTAR